MLFSKNISYAFEYVGPETSLFVQKTLKLDLLDELGVILLDFPTEVVEVFNVQPLVLDIEGSNVKLLNHDAQEILCSGGKRGMDTRHGDHYAFVYGDFIIKVYGDFAAHQEDTVEVDLDGEPKRRTHN